MTGDSSLSLELMEMFMHGSLCHECTFDGGGVVDCIGVKKYGHCLIKEAAERLKEVTADDGRRERSFN